MELNFSLLFSGILFFFFIWLFNRFLENFIREYECKKVNFDCNNCKCVNCIRYWYLYDNKKGG